MGAVFKNFLITVTSFALLFGADIALFTFNGLNSSHRGYLIACIQPKQRLQQRKEKYMNELRSLSSVYFDRRAWSLYLGRETFYLVHSSSKLFFRLCSQNQWKGRWSQVCCILLINKYESNPVNLCEATPYCRAAFWEITRPISSLSNMFTCRIDSNPSVSCVGFNQLTMLCPHVLVFLWASDAKRAPRFEMEMRNNLFCSGNGNFPPWN